MYSDRLFSESCQPHVASDLLSNPSNSFLSSLGHVPATNLQVGTAASVLQLLKLTPSSVGVASSSVNTASPGSSCPTVSVCSNDHRPINISGCTENSNSGLVRLNLGGSSISTPTAFTVSPAITSTSSLFAAIPGNRMFSLSGLPQAFSQQQQQQNSSVSVTRSPMTGSVCAASAGVPSLTPSVQQQFQHDLFSGAQTFGQFGQMPVTSAGMIDAFQANLMQQQQQAVLLFYTL
ncbi:unnamed protein product [Protopolystoma xenopodis]|uniref:Uncharacterized protein n=1 Tax=Protopolystoma xenopodis TaxID=117903 RepID=A0A3S5AYA4_9PLAT|nr:unnamed protein product [Protopolystoma xenopodis]